MNLSNKMRVKSKQIVLLIDEVAALHNVVLDALSGAFADLIQEGDMSKPFGGVPVILSGDPCQLGRVELYEKSPAYPPDEYPTRPCWEGQAWSDMDPVVMYLTSFHRGQDVGYLKLLAEVRAAPRLRAGVPHFSEESMRVLSLIRDRDGGQVPPRYPHTIICLTNREAEQFNRQHLEALVEEEELVIDAVDTEHGPLGSSFSLLDVEALGFKSSIHLKRGCRVMVTANDPAKHHTNGQMGTVMNFNEYGGDEPVVTVKLDGEGTHIDLRRQRLDVYGSNGEIIFTRRQVPLTLCAAVTAHKLVGVSLQGAWIHLPFKRVSAEHDDRVSAYWSATWISGGMYTIMSRVGDRSKIRIHPLRNTMDPDLLQPIFFIDPGASEFDASCKARSWLESVEGLDGSQESEVVEVNDRTPVSGGVELPHGDLAHIEHKIETLGTTIDKRLHLLAVSLHFASLQPSVEGNFTNPVVYCMMRPGITAKLSALPMDTQIRFYQELHERLNLTHDNLDDESLSTMVDSLPTPSSAPPAREPLLAGQEHHREASSTTATNHPSSPRPRRTSRCSQNLPDSVADPDSEAAEAADDESDIGEDVHGAQEEATAEEDDEDDLSLTEEQAGDTVPDPGGDKYGKDPFTIYRGHIYPVMKKFLEVNPHFRLVELSLKKLKYGRRQCTLECKRSTSTRCRGRAPAERARPDWRLWPEHVCKYSEVYVNMVDGRCYFYPLKSVGASPEQWREHKHPYGTEVCRSAYVPPDICDHWAEILHQRPDSTLDQLRIQSNERYLAGEYCPGTLQFIADKGLKELTKVRGAYRSMVENGKGGLSINRFVEQVDPLRRVPTALEDDFLPVLTSLLNLRRGCQTDEDLVRVRRADDCILLNDVLCEKRLVDQGGSELQHFAAVFSSVRMLSHLEGCKTVGLDGTYNVIYGDVVLLVVCALPHGETAKPVAICLLKRESTTSVSFALRRLMEAAAALDIRGTEPEEVVIDGAEPLHAAVKEVWRDARIISCYYHVKQRAKKAKAKAHLSGSLWRQVNRDLDVMGDAWGRNDWRELRDLFLRKYESNSTTLSPTDAESMKIFMTEFKHYLDDSDWRSRWGAYNSEISGPRTNNSVERFNSELKKTVLSSRHRRTLASFGAFLKCTARWMELSQYGHGYRVKGVPEREDRVKAKEFFTRDLFSIVPRSWDSGTTGNLGDDDN
ncbi:hypothetical protein FOZ61_000971 [Perkinsus olseni]|uniref:ATP-dependent DNA helicase n=1 Tax=Perkinsus olseni TaxID=32597 RepID=A0A7J6KSG1_PEROL|nr:hypothetical protein FOZ61_000971 [Perkinsus olseni]KAF4650652.1 hypothetical protein FOL46_000847 [Perkinsus olseni]